MGVFMKVPAQKQGMVIETLSIIISFALVFVVTSRKRKMIPVISSGRLNPTLRNLSVASLPPVADQGLPLLSLNRPEARTRLVSFASRISYRAAALYRLPNLPYWKLSVPLLPPCTWINCSTTPFGVVLPPLNWSDGPPFPECTETFPETVHPVRPELKFLFVMRCVISDPFASVVNNDPKCIFQNCVKILTKVSNKQL